VAILITTSPFDGVSKFLNFISTLSDEAAANPSLIAMYFLYAYILICHTI
jgi:hypothetical protein